MELLKKLYETYSPSGSEKRMRKFIKWWIRNNIPGAIIESDTLGNIYITRGISETYPCIVSHMDQVQKVHSKDFKAVETEDFIFGFSLKNKQQEGLGADDKNGIWCCLKCLEKFDVCKAAFFVQEEVGCIGSSHARMDFFTNCRFLLEADRRNGNDLITSIWGDLSSPEFLSDIDYEQFGYKPTNGLSTDVGTLKENGLNVCALNISCGYYEPHTDHEFTIKSELQNCLNFIFHIFENCTATYKHIDLGWNDPWNRYGLLDPYAVDEQYFELEEAVIDYLSYYPNTPVEIFYEYYRDQFPLLSYEDFEEIINNIKNQ